MVILAERYSKLITDACGERFKKILNEDQFRPMVVNDAKDLEKIRKSYPFDQEEENNQYLLRLIQVPYDSGIFTGCGSVYGWC